MGLIKAAFQAVGGNVVRIYNQPRLAAVERIHGGFRADNKLSGAAANA